VPFVPDTFCTTFCTADPDAIEAADQLANLTNGLSRSIWQKIMILDRAIEPPSRGNF
jgi:hypothetical protein